MSDRDGSERYTEYVLCQADHYRDEQKDREVTENKVEPTVEARIAEALERIADALEREHKEPWSPFPVAYVPECDHQWVDSDDASTAAIQTCRKCNACRFDLMETT